MLGLLLWLAAPSGITPEVVFRHATILAFSDYTDCLRDKSAGLELASASNRTTSVPALSVARSAEPLCKAEWDQFAQAFLAGVSSPSPEDFQSLDYFRRLGRGMTASEIVVARNGSCGLLPGPYQCQGLGKR